MSASCPADSLHDSATSDADTSTIDLLCAGNFPAQPVEWLWPDQIPIGKVTLLVGDPGSGKSLVALDIAARVSRAAPWPDANAESEDRSPQSIAALAL